MYPSSSSPVRACRSILSAYLTLRDSINLTRNLNENKHPEKKYFYYLYTSNLIRAIAVGSALRTADRRRAAVAVAGGRERRHDGRRRRDRCRRDREHLDVQVAGDAVAQSNRVLKRVRVKC